MALSVAWAVRRELPLPRFPALAVAAVLALIAGALIVQLTAPASPPTGHPVIVRTHTPETPTVVVYPVPTP